MSAAAILVPVILEVLDLMDRVSKQTIRSAAELEAYIEQRNAIRHKLVTALAESVAASVPATPAPNGEQSPPTVNMDDTAIRDHASETIVESQSAA